MSEDMNKPNLKEVFDALHAAKVRPDFLLTEVDRDRCSTQERPELDKMFDELCNNSGADYEDRK